MPGKKHSNLRKKNHNQQQEALRIFSFLHLVVSRITKTAIKVFFLLCSKNEHQVEIVYILTGRSYTFGLEANQRILERNLMK